MNGLPCAGCCCGYAHTLSYNFHLSPGITSFLITSALRPQKAAGRVATGVPGRGTAVASRDTNRTTRCTVAATARAGHAAVCGGKGVNAPDSEAETRHIKGLARMVLIPLPVSTTAASENGKDSRRKSRETERAPLAGVPVELPKNGHARGTRSVGCL